MQDWCRDNGLDYNTWRIQDMFGQWHNAKDIKLITTHNAVKWIKFMELMGNTPEEAYLYWCRKVNADGSCFGIVKTDHESKLGDVQQMSYQMLNTLPCTKDDVKEIAAYSVSYVELLKSDDQEFEKFLRKNANEVNHYEMMADLYRKNPAFADSKWYRYEKRQIIRTYVNKLRSGKIMVNGDNLTICSNPYALLLYAAGGDWKKDPTLLHEDGTIQCYTSRFGDGEFLCAFRSPHNSPNNICYLHNHYSPEMEAYFPFSSNIIAVSYTHLDDFQDFLISIKLMTIFSAVINCRAECRHGIAIGKRKCIHIKFFNRNFYIFTVFIPCAQPWTEFNHHVMRHGSGYLSALFYKLRTDYIFTITPVFNIFIMPLSTLGIRLCLLYSVKYGLCIINRQI